MKRSKIIPLSILLATPLLLTQWYCPRQGCALSPGRSRFNLLKSRTALPLNEDFDERVTLEAMLRPGNDVERWSQSRAASIEGYVVAVADGNVESANCFSIVRRDTHIDVALRPDAQPTERLIIEVTPAMRELMRIQGIDWSTRTLERELVGRRCRFEGWLLFDDGHSGESENTAPGRQRNWRATAWEIHPVTNIEVIR